MRRLVTIGLVVVVSVSLALTNIAYASSSTHSADLTQQKPARANSAGGHSAAQGISHGKGIDRPAVKRSPRRLDTPSPSHGALTSTTGKAKVRVGGSVATSSIAAATPELQANAPAANAPAANGPTANVPAANAPLLGGTFNGSTECCSIPPDPTMAVGPYQVVIATNDGYAAFDKNGTAVPNTTPCLGSCSLGSFFTNAVAGLFDPWLVYDQYINRYWFLTVSENDSPQNSDFLIALSNSDDVTAGWTLFRIDARTNGNDVQSQWCDYEKLGIDAQAIYLTCNMFDFPQGTGGFEYAKIRAMTKSQFVNNTCCTWWDWWNLREGFAGIYKSFSIQPAHMFGASNGDGEFLINAFNTCVFCPPDELRVRRITNVQVCCTPGDQHEPNMDEETQGVGNMPDAPNAAQQGSSTGIDPGDHRLLYAFWKGGHLATGQTIGCNSGNNACLAYTELDVSGFTSISTLSDFLFAEDGSDRYYPRVDPNASGAKSMVYTRSSSSEFASAVYLGIPNSSVCTNCISGPETMLQAGGNSYVDFGSPPGPRNRWGDYLGASPDPDGVGVWLHGQSAQTTANAWRTVVGLTFEAQDVTPPTTTASLAPLPTAFGWNRTSVLVTLSATDSGVAGVRRIRYSASGAQTIAPTVVNGSTASFTIASEGTTTVSFFARDNWGNVESTKTQIVRIDKTDPTVSCAAADGLWHPTDISISCTGSDALSGLANFADASFTLSTSVAAETETNNACTGTHAVLDRANNSTTAGPVCGNMIDKKAPTITITTPASGAIYLLNQSVLAAYACADGGSGVASCVGNVANGAGIDTASVGNKTFTVTGTDNVGNVRVQTVPYIVTYKICLQYDPTKAFHGNSAPIRLQLCDANDVNVSSPGITVHATVVNPGAIPATSTANPTNDFLFNSGQGGYIYVLNTKTLSAGSYTLEFTVTGDPITHAAPFLLN